MKTVRVGRFYIDNFANFPNRYFDLVIDDQYENKAFKELSINDLHDLRYLVNEAIRRNAEEE